MRTVKAKVIRVSHRLCGDDMPLLLFVESGDTFDRHVIRFRCSRRKDDVFRVSSNEVCDMLDS